MTSSSSTLWLYFGRLPIVALILFLCLLGVLYAAQDKLLLFPGTGAGSPARLVRAGWGEPWRVDGVFHGRVYQAAGEPTGTILVYHGNAGTIDDREPIAQVLAAKGLRVVLVEYPGYGERVGTADLNSLMGGSLATFERARRQWHGPMYLMGESLGAGIASQIAGLHATEVAGVLLMTPWDSLYKLANSKFYHVPVGLVLHQKLDSARALAPFRGPVVIVGAGQDTLIPVRHAQALAASLPGSTYVELPDAGHNSWFASLDDGAWTRLVAALTTAPAQRP